MAKEFTKEDFKAVYDTWFGPIRNFLYYKTGDVALTEDLVQDVFVRLWENRTKVRQESIKSYLYKIAQNLAINQLKKKQSAFRFVTEAKATANSTAEDTPALEGAEAAERQLQTALAQLSEKQRVVLLMHKMDGLPHKEIAQRLGISDKAVEKRMHKAMGHLRELLNKKNEQT